jgi:hypothetical protein
MITKLKAHEELVWALILMVLLVGSFIWWFAEFAELGSGPNIWATGLGIIAFFLSFVLVPLFYRAVESQWEIANKEYQTAMSQKEVSILERENQLKAVSRTFLTQEIVDRKLIDLAISVERLFEVEIQLREDVDEAQLAEVASFIRKAKADFWFTHALAKKLGFPVYDKIRDYTKL